MSGKGSGRVSVDLGEALSGAVSDAADRLGLTKAETLRRAAAYLSIALQDEEQGFCVGSWKELDNGIEKKHYVIR